MTAATKSLDDVLLDLVSAAMCSGVMRTVEDAEGIRAMLLVDPSKSFGELMEPAAREFLLHRASFRDEVVDAVHAETTS